jgi:hypothetical protein
MAKKPSYYAFLWLLLLLLAFWHGITATSRDTARVHLLFILPVSSSATSYPIYFLCSPLTLDADFDKAIQAYTDGINVLPEGHADLAVLYGNRSACYFNIVCK